ncbi:MAG: nucleoside 2-deoxyribosyltransferase [Solirubrobacteraceae bacterium]|nr:nucleoside 2-deoxyribosyltransferase [Solirubrobacteraceae bacterium]
MPSVYVASPLGFSPATRGYYDEVLLPAVAAAGWTIHDPWADLDGSVDASFAEAKWLGPESRLAALRQINRSLGQANEDLIRTADALFAVLDGTDVDSGTAAEIGFAAALGKPTIGLRLDIRSTGDNDGTVVNLQVQHFIETRGGKVFTELDEAVAALAALKV